MAAAAGAHAAAYSGRSDRSGLAPGWIEKGRATQPRPRRPGRSHGRAFAADRNADTQRRRALQKVGIRHCGHRVDAEPGTGAAAGTVGPAPLGAQASAVGGLDRDSPARPGDCRLSGGDRQGKGIHRIVEKRIECPDRPQQGRHRAGRCTDSRYRRRAEQKLCRAVDGRGRAGTADRSRCPARPYSASDRHQGFLLLHRCAMGHKPPADTHIACGRRKRCFAVRAGNCDKWRRKNVRRLTGDRAGREPGIADPA